jgi:PT repeat
VLRFNNRRWGTSMDEIDIKGVLRRHVTADAPPFPLTAAALLAQGRRRQRWRASLISLGSGGMAGIIAFVAAGVLTSSPLDPNVLAPPRPGLKVGGCDRSLPQAQWPILGQTEQPSTAEPAPQVSSVEPTPYPAEEPSNYPSQFPSDMPSDQPTAGSSDQPTAGSSDQPADTARWPSVAPTGLLPNDPGQAKIEAMACYVRGAALVLFPHASFAPASEPPLQVVRWPQLDFVTGWEPVYNVRAMVLEGERNGMFRVQVLPSPQATRAPEMPRAEVRPLDNGKTAYIDRTPYSLVVIVTTQRSWIIVESDGNMITVDQAIALASGPELDLFN